MRAHATPFHSPLIKAGFLRPRPRENTTCQTARQIMRRQRRPGARRDSATTPWPFRIGITVGRSTSDGLLNSRLDSEPRPLLPAPVCGLAFEWAT